MKIVYLILSFLLVFIIGFIFSSDRKKIKARPIIIMIVLEFILSWILLNTKVGIGIIHVISDWFGALMGTAVQGVNFVFGGMENKPGATFFLNVLLPIIFISILIGILNYIKVLPLIIRFIGFILSKINGMGKLENYYAITAAVIGQSEVWLTTKKQLGYLSKKRLYTLCTSSMSAVSMTIVGSYMQIIQPKYVVVAVVINILSALVIANIVNPYELDKEEDKLITDDTGEKPAFFQMVSDSIMDGFKVAVTVAAMLIGFMALIYFINDIFTFIFHISFQKLIGYIFAPVAFIMGVPKQDIVQAGSIMATKLVTNEFVAMTDLREIAHHLTNRTVGIVSVFLVSFANFSSIGIITGCVKALNPEKGDVVAKFGGKLLLGSTLASILSAAICGVFL
ncbi:nucleoside transport protein [Scopulibacillus daqui]|uniref:Nucleoside transport protein n=1 Tax=Scopulibacillus daqui TaxID=1469162 RepID=A0ABS2PVA3_9BACL|nr:nucleoside transporter C-terminal domain-containing protein [Scopulibacillus daqui]MBM7643883.1 nucleoside transport protein [Scopulibacillus daqui]